MSIIEKKLWTINCNAICRIWRNTFFIIYPIITALNWWAHVFRDWRPAWIAFANICEMSVIMIETLENHNDAFFNILILLYCSLSLYYVYSLSQWYIIIDFLQKTRTLIWSWISLIIWIMGILSYILSWDKSVGSLYLNHGNFLRERYENPWG